MVEINDIINAINRDILTEYEDVTFYVDFEPKDFERPSISIRLGGIGRQERIAHNIINQTIYFTVTYHCETNEYYRPDKMGMHDVLNGILKLYRSGSINVGDRFIRIQATSGGENENEVYIDLQIDITDNVTDSEPSEEKIKEVITRVKKEE